MGLNRMAVDVEGVTNALGMSHVALLVSTTDPLQDTQPCQRRLVLVHHIKLTSLPPNDNHPSPQSTREPSTRFQLLYPGILVLDLPLTRCHRRHSQMTNTSSTILNILLAPALLPICCRRPRSRAINTSFIIPSILPAPALLLTRCRRQHTLVINTSSAILGVCQALLAVN